MPAVPPAGRLKAQTMPPIRIVGTINPVKRNMLSEDRCVFDFGRNFSGWCEVTVSGPRGSMVAIKHGETVHADGSVNTDNLRLAKATDKYILAGRNEEFYQPRFTYHGFRYAEVRLLNGAKLLKIEGKAVHTDVKQTAGFETSSEILNRIYEAYTWSEKTNMHGIPTDCPQRDERMGWLNDMTVRCETSLINFDLRLFYEKWIEDIFDEQTEKGSVPDTAPHVYGGNPAFHVSASCIFIPWFVYLYYGDHTLICRYYDRMKKNLEFLASQAGDNWLIGEPYYGDWASPAAYCHNDVAWGALPWNIPAPIVTTGYMYYCARVMEKIAQLTGMEGDVPRFREIASNAERAINLGYYRREEGFYDDNSQGSNTFPLFLGIVREDEKSKVVKNLLEGIKKEGYRITTGNQMTKHLFEVLCNEGLNDVALRILEGREYPSLGYMIDNGATTIWERWENLTGSGMNSHNHPMHGSCTAWFFKAIAGFRLDRHRGLLGEITIEPAIDLDLKYARTFIDTAKGRISCSWTKKKDSTVIDVCIPWNTSACLKLKNPGKQFLLTHNGRKADTSGKHITVKLDRGQNRIRLDYLRFS